MARGDRAGAELAEEGGSSAVESERVCSSNREHVGRKINGCLLRYRSELCIKPTIFKMVEVQTVLGNVLGQKEMISTCFLATRELFL